MTVLIFCLALAVVSAAVYWYLRFRWVLPFHEQIVDNSRTVDSIQDLVRTLSSSVLVPASPGILKEVIHSILNKLNRLFPGLQFWTFILESGGTWNLVAQAGAHSSTPEISCSVLDSGHLARVMVEGKPIPVSILVKYETSPGGFFKAVQSAGVRTVLMVKWGDDGGDKGVLVAGSRSGEGEDLRATTPYLETVQMFFSGLWKNAKDLWDLKKKERELEKSISLTIQDLTATNIQLAQRSREMKTLYEVAATITADPSSPQSSLTALVSIIAKALEADLCAFMLLDEEGVELVSQPGAYGIAGDEASLQRIPLSNKEATSVRVFLSGRPFLTGNAQNDPSVSSHYLRIWKVRSLMVVPLRIQDRVTGILRVGGYKENLFSEDQLRFVTLIAEEAAVIIESSMLYQKVAEAARQLADLNRLKDDFLSTVSHELKTPLTSIHGFLSVVLSGATGPLEGQTRKFLIIARNATDRLNVLIGDLLDISKLEGGVQMEFQEASLAEIVNRSVELHSPQAAEAQVSVKASLPEKLGRVWADPRWISQVLDNIISNAIKFTPRGGSVRLRAEDKGDMALVCVSDTGTGIPARDKPKIFDKFFRSKQPSHINSSGTGLGLAIAKTVIEKHKGKIWADSEEGRGSKFYFVLPTCAKKR